MTSAPKVGRTRARLRKDTGGSGDERGDGLGETCDELEASPLQVECALDPHMDREGYDNQEVSLELSVDASDTNDQVDNLGGLGKGVTPAHAPLPEPTPLGVSHVLGPLSSAPLEEATLMVSEVNDELNDELNDEPVLGSCIEPASHVCETPNATPMIVVPRPAVCAWAGTGTGPRRSAGSLTSPHARALPTGVRRSLELSNSYTPLASLVEEGEEETSELRAEPDEAEGSVLKAPPSDALDRDGEHAYMPTPRHGNARFIGDRPEWSKRRQRRLGPLHAHASFLQHMFRRACLVRPGCWRRGGFVGLCLWRPVNHYECGQGLNLASEAEFKSQAAQASKVLAWYRNYVELLRILQGGRTPTVVEGCCGGGGKTEGVRRAGGASHGIDIRPQPDFQRRFGTRCFTQGDATSPLLLKSLIKATGAFGVSASPPCKARSTARQRGEPQDPDLMDATRDALMSTGLLYGIECVVGAGPGMAPDSTRLNGATLKLYKPCNKLCNMGPLCNTTFSLVTRANVLHDHWTVTYTPCTLSIERVSHDLLNGRSRTHLGRSCTHLGRSRTHLVRMSVGKLRHTGRTLVHICTCVHIVRVPHTQRRASHTQACTHVRTRVHMRACLTHMRACLTHTQECTHVRTCVHMRACSTHSGMYTCTYICTHACVSHTLRPVHMYVHVYTCVRASHTQECTHVRTRVHMRACLTHSGVSHTLRHVHMYVHVYTCVRASHTQACTHVRTCVHMRACSTHSGLYTCTYMCTHACV